MARFRGAVGYAEPTEIEPGIWADRIIERIYGGDVERNTSQWVGSSVSINDDLKLNNQISIVADPYAYQNFRFMRYVEFMGVKWKIVNVETRRPRLILTVGGVYNGEQT